jgi:PAS domain-containing protein
MWKNSKVMRILRQPSPLRITIYQKQLENVEYFNHLGSMIIKDAICRLEIKSRIAMANASFRQKTGLKLKEEIMKRYIWGTA